jgi:hypothetical protein
MKRCFLLGVARCGEVVRRGRAGENGGWRFEVAPRLKRRLGSRAVGRAASPAPWLLPYWGWQIILRECMSLVMGQASPQFGDAWSARPSWLQARPRWFWCPKCWYSWSCILAIPLVRGIDLAGREPTGSCHFRQTFLRQERQLC